MTLIPREVCKEVNDRANGCSEVSHNDSERLVFLQLVRGKGKDFVNGCNFMKVTKYEVLAFYLLFMDTSEKIGRTKEDLIKVSNGLATQLCGESIVDGQMYGFDGKLQAATEAWRAYFEDHELPTQRLLHEVTLDSRRRRPTPGFLKKLPGLQR